MREWDLLVREMGENKVPGLKLYTAADADLGRLAGLTELRYLYLWGTQITDAGLGCLKDLHGLQELHLSHTRISDAGLARLGGLTELSRLDLIGTQVTDAGVQQLQRSLPRPNVRRNQPTQEPVPPLSPRRAESTGQAVVYWLC